MRADTGDNLYMLLLVVTRLFYCVLYCVFYILLFSQATLNCKMKMFHYIENFQFLYAFNIVCTIIFLFTLLLYMYVLT